MIIKKTIQKAGMHHPSSWVLLQKWEHLLFIHLPVSRDALAAQLPKGVELDTYDGQAWISIVAFKVSKNRFRYLPGTPFLRPMLQLNVRTYVKRNGERGVYFFTMDTNKFVVVLGAKIVHAPFLHADMKMETSADAYYLESSRRGEVAAKFQASYTPVEAAFYPETESLDYWLLERYIFWSYKKDSLYRGDIQHKQWQVQNAEVTLEKQTMVSFLSKELLGGNPVIHYSRSKVAFNGMIKRVE